jgi:hypothetical protein
MTNLAFVLMPFSTEFDDVYSHIIKSPLEEAGFTVRRADNASGSRNIMHDVIEGILSASLVVADLTGSNPNVYYELGIAHGFRKNVLLLTQDVEEIPFDLRAYRIVSYSTHFARVAEARGLVLAAGVGVRDSTSNFGSPVSDFLALDPARLPTLSFQVNVDKGTEPPSEAGLLDALADIAEGMHAVTEIISEVGSRLSSLSESVTAVGGQMSGPLKHEPIRLRTVVRKMAVDTEAYTSWLKGANASYRTGLAQVSEGLEALFSTGLAHAPEGRDGLLQLISGLEAGEVGARQCRLNMDGISTTLDALPRIEKDFNRAKRRMSEETQSLVANLDQTISLFERTRVAAEQVLRPAT